MRRKNSFVAILTALCTIHAALQAQIVTIQGTDTLAASRTTINNNFSFLASSKAARWFGITTPGAIPLSIQGDLFFDTTGLHTYACYSVLCSSSPNWVRVDGLTSVVNDTNVTGLVAGGVLTLGWTGLLAKARIIASAVFNDQANAYSTGLQDFRLASLQITTGTGAPVSGCTLLAHVGKLYTRQDAQAVNASLYSCNQTGVGVFAWELMQTAAGAASFSALLDFNVTNSGATQNMGPLCSSLLPCQVRNNSVGSTVLTSPATVTLTGTNVGGTNFGYWYWTAQQVLTFGHNAASTATCNGNCNVATGVTGFPVDSIPLWITTFTSLAWNTLNPATMDKRASMSNYPVKAGPGNAEATDINGIKTISTDPNVTPIYLTGSGAPGGTCTPGRHFYTDTAGQHFWFCYALNTWKQGDSGGVTWFGGTVVAPVPGNWNVLGTGCTTSTVTSANGGNALKIIGRTGVQQGCGDYIPQGAGDFTKSFVLYGALNGQVSSQIGVGFGDGTKAEVCNITTQNTGAFSTNTIQYTNLTTIAGAAPAEVTYMASPGPIFLQLNRTGTALKCSWSPDGGTYFPLFNDTVPFLTADRLVVVVDPRGSGAASTAIVASFQ